MKCSPFKSRSQRSAPRYHISAQEETINNVNPAVQPFPAVVNAYECVLLTKEVLTS